MANKGFVTLCLFLMEKETESSIIPHYEHFTIDVSLAKYSTESTNEFMVRVLMGPFTGMGFKTLKSAITELLGYIIT